MHIHLHRYECAYLCRYDQVGIFQFGNTWKRQCPPFPECHLWTPAQPHKRGLAPGILLFRETRSPHSLCQAWCLVQDCPSMLLFLPTGVHPMAFRHAPASCPLGPTGEGSESCACRRRGYMQTTTLHLFGEKSSWLWGPTPTPEADVALSLLFGSRSCFIQCLCDVCLSRNPRRSEQKAWDCCSWQSETPPLEVITANDYSTEILWYLNT